MQVARKMKNNEAVRGEQKDKETINYNTASMLQQKKQEQRIVNRQKNTE